MSDLMIEALNEMYNISESELSDMFECFFKITSKNIEILINKSPSEVLSGEIENKLNQLSSNLKSVQKEDIKTIAEYLKIVELFSNKSTHNDIRWLYPVFLVFYYFRIEPEFLVKVVNEAVISEIISNISEFFSEIEDEFSLAEDVPYYEKEAFLIYQKGLEKKDLENVYSFIEGVERGKGIHANLFVTFLAELLLLEPKSYFYFLNSAIEPFKLVKFINIIENKFNSELMKLIITSDNQWMIFEYLRQIFKDLNHSNRLKKEDVELISLLLNKLNDINTDFFVDAAIFLAKFKNKKCIGLCLGNALAIMNEKEVLKRIIDTIGINDNHFYLDLVTWIGKSLEKENKELLIFMGEYTFRKWDKFLNDRFKSAEIVIKILFTDYLRIVIWYLQECLSNDKSEFLELLEKKLDTITNYKSYWVKYPSRKRLICLTYVYAMSEAWKNVLDSKIDKELEDKFLMVIDDTRMLVSLPDFDDQISSHISKIKANFKV